MSLPGREENLKPVRSTEEARERGRKGGIKSGEARRKKRSMKQAAKMLLDMPVGIDSVSEQMAQLFGIEEDDLTNQMALVVSVFKEALNGNIRAAEFLRDTAGENHSSNREYALEKREADRRDAEFEYRKQKEAGLEYEIEDMDEIEGVIYGGEAVEQGRPEGRPDADTAPQDDTVPLQ